jgi:hypothetical protein
MTISEPARIWLGTAVDHEASGHRPPRTSSHCIRPTAAMRGILLVLALSAIGASQASPVAAQPGPLQSVVTDRTGAAKSAVTFTRAINRARAALASRDPQAARRHLDRAKELAESPPQRETVRRLDALRAQLANFLDALRAGLPKFTAADELQLDDTVVVVIETGENTMALRSEGSRHDYTLATLPAPVALIVARAGADENAATSKVFFGAFHAVDPKGDRALARQLWQSAAEAGEPVADLLPLLEGAALAIERVGIPDAAARAEAEGRIAKEFAVTIKGARSPEQKRYLVSQLLAAADESDDLTDQYALLSEACARAATAGDARRALAAVDELARWFEVDAPALKTATLAKAGAGSRNPDAARQVAQAALALLKEVEGREELARSLALTAVNAARRTRDSELVKKAADRRREIERPAKK